MKNHKAIRISRSGLGVNLRQTRKQTSVTRQTTSALLEMLRSGDFKVGDKLPTEVELTRILGVGRSAVREAMRELVVMNLVEIRRGNGTYVRSLRSELLVNPNSFGEAANDVILEELLEVRQIFERETAALAAERATESDIQRLQEDVRRLREAVSSGYQPPEDYGFHIDVVYAAHNSALVRVSEAIISFHARTSFPPSARDVEEHQQIFEAIRDRNPEKARQAMDLHLSAERKQLEKYHESN